jgi:hypothetical protein
MENKELNPSESIAIIHEMIANAKNKLADDGFLYIFWGWLVMAAALINYFSVIAGSHYGYYVWPVLMPLGAIVSIIYGIRQKKKENVKTYIDTYLTYLWIAFIIALVMTLAFMPLHGVKTTYFFLMVLYGIATLISGGLLQFRPLVIGSLFSFLFAILSVFAGENEQFLCIAAALLFSYIIPGHLLRNKFRSQKDV